MQSNKFTPSEATPPVSDQEPTTKTAANDPTVQMVNHNAESADEQKFALPSLDRQISAGTYQLTELTGESSISFFHIMRPVLGANPRWEHEDSSEMTVIHSEHNELHISASLCPKKSNPSVGITNPYKVTIHLVEDNEEKSCVVSHVKADKAELNTGLSNVSLNGMQLKNPQLPLKIKRHKEGEYSLETIVEVTKLNIESSVIRNVAGLFAVPVKLTGKMVKKRGEKNTEAEPSTKPKQTM